MGSTFVSIWSCINFTIGRAGRGRCCRRSGHFFPGTFVSSLGRADAVVEGRAVIGVDAVGFVSMFFYVSHAFILGAWRCTAVSISICHFA